jgi:DNA-binding IclR family transcriptional regulator
MKATLARIRARGYLERDSAQTQGVVDISFPLVNPYTHANWFCLDYGQLV